MTEMAQTKMDCIYARETQYNYVISVLKKSRILPSALLAWGRGGSGKSFVIEKAIEDVGIEHVAMVSAREIVCGAKQFLCTIVKQLFEPFRGIVDLENFECENTMDFVNVLCEVGIKTAIMSKRLVVLIEEAETLRTENGEILEVLSRLQDLVQFNICVIFLSSLPLSSYSCLLEFKPMITLHFPQYTKDEMINILIREVPVSCDKDLFSFHVKMTVSIFYMACRDLRKLQRLTLLNFEEFIKPLPNDGSKVSQKRMHELWKAIQPKLVTDFKTLKANIIPANTMNEFHGRYDDNKRKHIHVLPRSTKFLLLSAFLATYNPPSSDKRFFVKSQLGKKRRRINEANESDKIHEPQLFSQSRLFAIYGFLTEHIVPKNQILMSQLTQLGKLELLERVDSVSAILEEPKYKCLATLDFIEDVSKSLDLDLKRYLHHLV